MTGIRVGIIRINNACALEDNLDKVSHHLVRVIDQGILGFAKVEKVCCVPEDRDLFQQKLTKLVMDYKMHLILTLGRVTANSSENIAVTVTNSLVDSKLPGLINVLSRPSDFYSSSFFGGIWKTSIIINLPDILTLARRSLNLIAPDVILLTSMLFENDAPEFERLITRTQQPTQNNFIQLSVTEAERRLISSTIALRKIITVSLPRALGLVLAEDVRYDSEVPPFDISSVSGYAVVSTDHIEERDVIGFCAAQQEATNLHVVPGTCVRVQKYAGIPSGADAVIDDEFVFVVNNSQIIVQPGSVRKNMNILSKDSLRGILVKGTLLMNAFIDHLRDNNVLCVKVYKMPDVAVFSTFPTQRQHWLINILRNKGFHGAWNAGIPSDTRQWFEELQDAFKVADVAVTIGVSSSDCVLNVLNADFLLNVYATGEGQNRVFFATIFLGQRKIWFGFPSNVTEYSVEKFLLTPLFHMANRQYAQQRRNLASQINDG